jgi:hypothetical protein
LDRLQHAGKVLQELIIPEAQNAITAASDLRDSGKIGLFVHCVLAAIDLDRELVCWAGEIDDVTADRMLPAKRFPTKVSRSAFHKRRSASVACRRSLRAIWVRSLMR